ncbi:PaaX family transcriptional regulator C-terminal domain-containing protein [Arthrobacter sp. W4I7]|uniref:PaaX family transcriptional regulator n=1 Tax=Arthrobacter sp. W4I7 TaxID=3042296 RepID=UPI002781FF96|nr:PaaX family transcriptional regulator C-terminal domain-containing protein [Arthrobacter sp. W4I7]MDQ0693069.1 phenylacetic acid degradation operon negative regulatory protein [Arthrobacter sp. W4I7]
MRRELGAALQPGPEAAQRFLEDVRAAVTEGPRPRQVLLTLLADYWLSPDAQAPSGALVELLADFDIPASGARTLLGRLCRDERIQLTKIGRRTFYSLSPWLRQRLVFRLETMNQFGRADVPFAGQWTCVAFSVPEENRGDRHKLRAGLAWLGFAPLYDGFWITPRPMVEEARKLLAKLGVLAATVFQGSLTGEGRDYGEPTDAWNLEQMAGLYRNFLNETEPLASAPSLGSVSPVEALIFRTELINVWRAFPNVDPDLPLDLLPPDWPRTRAREVFQLLYGGLAQPALARVKTVVAAHAPEYVDQVQYHLTGDPAGPVPKIAAGV